MAMETFEVENQPPSMLFCVLYVELLSGRPFRDQLMRAGGLEGAVRQLSCTESPTLASVAPEMVTSLGATLRIIERGQIIKIMTTQWFSFVSGLTQNS